MAAAPTLREEIYQELEIRIHQELEIRTKGRYYGHVSPDSDEAPREVQVKKLYLVLAGDCCPGCDQALEEYAEEIKSGDIIVLDSLTDDKGIEIVTTLGFYALPALIAEDEEGDYVVVDNTT